MDLHEKCIKLWEYLHETGSKDKKEAYEVLGFTQDKSYCPACQHVWNIKGWVDCSICPVHGSWVDASGEEFCDKCTERGSSYRDWESSDDIKYRKLFAGYVLESVRDWWEEEE